MSDLSAWTTSWMDQHFDPTDALLWNPPRSLHDDLPAHAIHLVPQNAWYVLGLLQRGTGADEERAMAIVDSLVDLQYDEPGTPWHGTYARFAETPHPVEGAVEWEDYDPNWRQFVGTALTIALRSHGHQLPPDTRRKIEDTIRLAVAGEPPNRLTAHYTNIALKHAWLQVEWGDAEAGEQLASDVVELFDRTGAFFEFNSPTYYGVDLWGLALWRGHSSSERLREWGARLEAALWQSTAAHYHAGLRNMVAPYMRAYGLDMGRYVAQVALWIWEGVGAEHAPLPDLDGELSHSHDLCFGPCPPAVGVQIPDDAVDHFRRFSGERTVHTEISAGRRGRRASAWLADDVMLGGETGGWDFGDWDQFVAGAVHWRQPDGTVGAIRVRQPHCPDVTAEPGALHVGGECRILWDRRQLDAGNHSLPGLDLDITTADDVTTLEVR